MPGFNRFRSNSKFIYPASLFVALLAGMGLDQLLFVARRFKVLAYSVLTIALLAVLGGIAIRSRREPMRRATGVPSCNSLRPPLKVFSIARFTRLRLCRGCRRAGRPEPVYRGRDLSAAGDLCCSLSTGPPQAGLLRNRLPGDSGDLHLEYVQSSDVRIERDSPSACRAFQSKRISRRLSDHYCRKKATMPSRWGRPISAATNRSCPAGMPNSLTLPKAVDPDQADVYLNLAGYYPLYSLLRCRYVFVNEKTIGKRLNSKMCCPTCC